MTLLSLLGPPVTLVEHRFTVLEVADSKPQPDLTARAKVSLSVQCLRDIPSKKSIGEQMRA